MGRTEPGGYSTGWTPPSYTVDETGKVVGGYRPEGPNNWGRWGDDDQRGTQNLIGPAERVAAAGLVRTGKVFSLALPIDRDGALALVPRPAPMLLPAHDGLATRSSAAPTTRRPPASSGATTCCRCPPRAPPSGTPSAT